MKKRMLIISPHLSTGGLPQYLLKFLKDNEKDYDFFVYEIFYAGAYDVQRKQILNLLDKNNFYSLSDEEKNRDSFIKILTKKLDEFKPDFVYFAEIPELFGDYLNAADIIYNDLRKIFKFKIIETTHDSGFNVEFKRYVPDIFYAISEFSLKQYLNFLNKNNVKYEIREYILEKKSRPNRKEALEKLDLDVNKFHVLNVGLFTPRKNQGEIFNYASEILKEYGDEIQFHFVGNFAENFKFYWEPLFRNIPDNVIIHGERNNVDDYYSAMDLFLFTSRGTEYDRETNPISVKEALSWQMPVLMYNLPVYLDMYDKEPLVEYLKFNDFEYNKNLILKYYLKFKNKEIYDLNEEKRKLRIENLLIQHRVHNLNTPENRLFGLNELCKKYIKSNFKIAEIGCFHGISTQLFANYAEVVYAIDPWEFYTDISKESMSTAEKIFDLNTSFYKNIKKIKKKSIDAVLDFKKNELDLVYIDGFHTEEALFLDILFWYSRVKENGYIAGHDYNYYDPDKNIRLLNTLEKLFNLDDVEVFEDSSWIVKKEKINKEFLKNIISKDFFIYNSNK